MIYYDGDSFSFMGVQNNTGTFLADHFGTELQHYGYVRKAPEKVIRTAERHALMSDAVYFIGIGLPHRYEKSEIDFIEYDYPNNFIKDEHSAVTVDIDLMSKELAIEYSYLHEPQFIQYKLLSQLILLHDFMMYHNKNFLIHNLASNYGIDHCYEFGKQWIQEVINRPRMLNFFGDSLHDLMKKHNLRGYDYDKYGDDAHPTEEGHRMYADYLIRKYNTIY